MKPIDADAMVTVEFYDDEREEYYTERMTIAECLDRYTEEGCPTIKTKQIKYYDEDENVWKTGEVIVDGEREDE